MKKNTITLNDSEREELRESMSNIKYDKNGDCRYIRELRKTAYRKFPDRLLNILVDQKSVNRGSGYFVFENLPIDIINKTPLLGQNTTDVKKTEISENILLAISSVIGEPYSITVEGNGLVNNLLPYSETKDDFTGLGSEAELDFHIENSALSFLYEQDNLSPSALLLFGLVSNEENPVKTKISNSKLALSLLSNDDIFILKSNSYIIQCPYRWRSVLPYSKLSTSLVPLVIGPINNPKVFAAFYQGMVLASNHKAEVALKNFYQAVKEVSTYEIITPGKLVYINNKYTMHSRDSFTPDYSKDGRPDRWLQRVFISDSLSGFRRLKQIHNRVFCPSENYE